MKNLFTLILVLFFQSLIYGQTTYDQILFKASKTKLIKTTTDDYFMSGSILIPNAYDDIFLTQFNPETGENDEVYNIGTNEPDFNNSVTLANSGNEFVYAANTIDNVIIFGILDSNGEAISSFQYQSQQLGSIVKVIHSNTSDFIFLTSNWINNNESEITVNKFGTNGSLIWSIELGDASSFNSGVDILRTQNNTYMVLGSKGGSQNGNKSTLIYEISDSGEVLWEAEYETGLDSEAQKIKQKENNIYSILINESETGTLSEGDYIKVLNVNLSGEIIDSIVVSDDDIGIYAFDFIISDDSYVFAGRTFPGQVGVYDNLLIKTTNSGEHIWSNEHPIPPPTATSATNSYFNSIINYEDGYLISGDWFNASYFFAT